MIKVLIDKYEKLIYQKDEKLKKLEEYIKKLE
jgi:hypothetical protein